MQTNTGGGKGHMSLKMFFKRNGGIEIGFVFFKSIFSCRPNVNHLFLQNNEFEYNESMN